MRPPPDLDPVGQLVVVGVGVVEEAALLHHQAPRVDARAVAAVPAERPLAGRLAQGLDGAPDVRALLLLRQIVVLDPPPAVRAHVEAGRPDGRGGGRIALQRERAAEDGEGQPALLEDPHHAPEAHAAAVLEHALGGQVAPGDAGIRGGAGLRPRPLREALAVGHRGLRALLVVHDEVDRDARVTGPLRVGRSLAVADQIPEIWTGHGGVLLVCGRRRARRDLRIGSSGAGRPRWGSAPRKPPVRRGSCRGGRESRPSSGVSRWKREASSTPTRARSWLRTSPHGPPPCVRPGCAKTVGRGP